MEAEKYCKKTTVAAFIMLCLIFKAFYIHIVCDNKYLQTPSTVALYRFQIIDVLPFFRL